MKFDLDNSNARHTIQSVTAGSVVINGERHTSSVVLGESMPATPWTVTTMEALDQEQMTWLASLDYEVLLIGTGSRLRFPPAAALGPLYQSGIGFEVMDTAAACRSYVILAAEGRQVCAALLIEEEAPDEHR